MRLPNLENPLDDDGDNIYQVTVMALDDSFNSGTLEITLPVINLTE